MTILPQLERDLFNAAEARLRTGVTAPRRRSTAGVPLILSTAVAVLVVAVALVVLRGGHQPVQRATPTTASGGSPRSELIKTFGVLRRPQTKGDLDPELLGASVGPRVGSLSAEPYIPLSGPASFVKQYGYPELDRRLARVVKIPAWAAKVSIAPATFQPSPSSPRRSEGLTLALWVGSKPTVPPSSLGGTGPRPTALATVLAHGLAFADPAPGNDLIDAVVLVPDGVASVELGPFALSLRRPPPGVSVKALDAALVAVHGTATVRENIAAFQFAMPVVAANPPRPAPSVRSWEAFGIETQAPEVWLDARGQVVKRTTARVDLIVRIRFPKAR